MKRYLLFGMLLCCCVTAVSQTANHVVISQVYGGGGNTGAQYRNDFIELYNPTGTAVLLNGWSLQYASVSGSNWNSNTVPLSGSILPGRYFLVQLAGGNNGVPLPAPDLVSAAINIAATGGKVALVRTATVLTDTCPKHPDIVDFIGFGSGINCFEGTVGGGPATGTTTAIYRKNNGCTDANDNRNDLLELAPAPRNSSRTHSCSSVITQVAVAPLPFCVNATTGAAASLQYRVEGVLPPTLTVLLSDSAGNFVNPAVVGTLAGPQPVGSISISLPAGLPSSTRYRLRIDANTVIGEVGPPLEVINGARNAASVTAFPDQNEVAVQWTLPSGCYDELMVVCKQGSTIAGIPVGDGSAYMANSNFGGDGTLFDDGRVVYKGVASGTLVRGLELGSQYFFKVFTRRGSDWSSGVEANATTRVIPAPGEVLINAFSPRYNAASDEYYELVNTTGVAFNLADLQLAYQSPTGGARLPLPLSSTLPPYSFWLLAPEAGRVTVGKTVNLQGNATSGSGIQDNGYIALVRRKDGQVVDAIAYGNVSGGTFVEGRPIPVTSGFVGGYKRVVDGMDNNENSTDFVAVATADIDLRNGSSRLAGQGATIAGGSYTRLYVTGNSALGGNVNLSDKLVFAGGRLALRNLNLTVPVIEGIQGNSYVQTNGSGSLIVPVAGAAPFLFPVGNSTYNPVTIANGNGRSWRVRVQDDVTAFGRQDAVLRTWHISPQGTVAPPGVTLTFQYNEGDAAQLGSSFTAADGVQVWTNHGTGWTRANTLVPAGGAAGAMRTVTLANWQLFSPFVVASAAAVLPVRFGPLRLSPQEQYLSLSFTAFDERYMDRYDVEWSADGMHFISIGTLAPRNRGGMEQYTFSDRRQWTGKGFYRVKGREQSGALFYSAVIAWTATPTHSDLQVIAAPGGSLTYNLGTLPAGSYLLQVVDGMGRQLWQQTLQHNNGRLTGTLNLPHSFRGWAIVSLHGLGGRWRTTIRVQ